MNDSNVSWQTYVSFVNDIVYENILSTIGISLGYIVEQMYPSNNLAPLFESQLELLDPSLVFVPSLDPNDKDGFNNLLILLIDDIMKMSSIFKCLKSNEKSYMTAILKNSDIIDMKYEILESVEKVVEEATEFCNGFERYSYLWLDDRDKCMEMFLEYGRFLESDELDFIVMRDSNAPQPCQPSIEAFREQIENYESLYAEIEKIHPFQVFNTWFQVDVRPFRQSLLNIVRKWGNMFKNHLVNRVTSSLIDLANFIRQ
ncbi:dynein beta chain, ciliary-like, partial [Contarinia nasturtii]|uniref:dynein beta chain, ciliary-like n=1 Tax=Contarinia nasturtii TaxID=265458 RepID=UPI0012D38431